MSEHLPEIISLCRENMGGASNRDATSHVIFGTLRTFNQSLSLKTSELLVANSVRGTKLTLAGSI